MKIYLSIILILQIIFSYSAFAAEQKLKTGLFEDTTGYIDKKTSQSVLDAQNLLGYRYIAIQTNMKGSIVNNVNVYNQKNMQIELGTPLNISKTVINNKEYKNAILKLWLKAPAGTKFYIVYYLKN